MFKASKNKQLTLEQCVEMRKRKDLLTQSLVNMIISCDMDLKMVEETAFVNFFTALRSTESDQLPSE